MSRATRKSSIRGKKKTTENVHLQLKGAGVLVMQDMDKASSPQLLLKRQNSGIPRDQHERLERESCTLVEENQVREHLNKLDIHKPLSPTEC